MGAGPLVLELIVVFLLSLFMLHQYGNLRQQSWLVSLFTLFGWYLAFTTIFILPLDVVLTFYHLCETSTNAVIPSNATTYSLIIDSNHTNCKVPFSYLPEEVLPTFWRFNYWSAQLLTWLILPILQSYSLAGAFTVRGKLLTALRENAIYYASYLLVFGVLLIYVAAKGWSLSPQNFKVICITASNTWGLFLLVLLLGYGLVEIPRKFWLLGGRGYQLQHMYFEIEKLSVEKNDVDEALRDAFLESEGIIQALDKATGHRLRAWAEIVYRKFPEYLRAKWTRRARQGADDTRASMDRSRNSRLGENIMASLPSEDNLCRLHKRVITLLQQHHRTHAEWDYMLRQALYLEDVARNESNPSKRFVHTHAPVRNPVIAFLCTPMVEWYWSCLLFRPFMRALAIFLLAMSVLIVWCEVTFFSDKPVLSLAAIFVRMAANNYDYGFIQSASILTMLYLGLCAYYTVFKLRIYRYCQLDPHHNTDENSLLFSATMLTRLTPPLCLNFLSLVHLDTHWAKDYTQETSFTQIMGHMDIIGFISAGFNVYYPMLILLICLGTYIRLGSRVLHWLGFEQFLESDDMTTELVQAGRSLVQLERNRRERERNRTERDEYWQERLGVGQGANSGRSEPAAMQRFNETAPRMTTSESAGILEHAQPLDYTYPHSRQYGSPDATPSMGIFDDI